MEPIYKYAILRVVPDQRRAEQINVGIVVFSKRGLDIRFAGISKLKAIALGNWAEYAVEFTERMQAAFSADVAPADFVRGAAALEGVVRFSDVASFFASTDEEYEARISEIIGILVRKPRIEGRVTLRSTRINTEIARVLKTAKLLAGPDEGLETHKVLRDYYVSKSEQLKADFVYKNGKVHVTATLDLRRQEVAVADACEKAFVLLKSKDAFEGVGKRLGVYAAIPGVEQFKPHIEILGDYSDDIFNWLVRDQREKFTQLMFKTLEHPDGLFAGDRRH